MRTMPNFLGLPWALRALGKDYLLGQTSLTGRSSWERRVWSAGMMSSSVHWVGVHVEVVLIAVRTEKVKTTEYLLYSKCSRVHWGGATGFFIGRKEAVIVNIVNQTGSRHVSEGVCRSG